MNLTVMKTMVTRGAGRSALILRKYSPEILMVTGVVGIVTSTVLACRATLRADEILDETKDTLDKINETKKLVDNGTIQQTYTEEQYKRDLAVTYVQSGWKFVKLYGPSITLGVASIACILTSHGIMRRRNLALVAAYKTIEKSFSDYRKRVVAELGEGKDREFKYGIKKVDYVETTTDENGKKVKEKKTVEVADPSGVSQYARWFDKTSREWDPSGIYNATFVVNQQKIANDILNARGHIFLNEVYDMLGFEHSMEGSVMGWVKGHGDDYVDFGIYNLKVAEGIAEQRVDFVNGLCDSVLLDFNVTLMYDKI
jgi:hypothetical protein